MSGKQAICEFLAFDSELFGMALARLNADRLTPETVECARRWCSQHEIAGLYLLADAGDPETARLAAEHGFVFADLRMTLTAALTPRRSEESGGLPIRLSREEDTGHLREIARISHRDSRFYFDPRFSREACDRLYQIWIEKSCGGWAEAVLVADAGSRPVGYVTCHLRGAAQGQIGLVGVDPGFQGRGVGKALIQAALDWFRARGATGVEVVTQGRNWGAQRLYQRCGFLTSSAQVWYHAWMPESGWVAAA